MKDAQQQIAALSGQDALTLLKILAHRDENLAAQIVEIAGQMLHKVDPDQVAAAVVADLESLEAEEVWARAGRTRHGYVDTSEAADAMMAEALQPYLDELQKYQRLGLNVPARRQCMGLILGLYEFEALSTTPFKEWAVDLSVGYAGEVIFLWKQGLPGPADVAALKKFIRAEGISWQLAMQ